MPDPIVHYLDVVSLWEKNIVCGYTKTHVFYSDYRETVTCGNCRRTKVFKDD